MAWPNGSVGHTVNAHTVWWAIHCRLTTLDVRSKYPLSDLPFESGTVSCPMADSERSKPGLGTNPPIEPAAEQKSSPANSASKAGRVVHDSRGNAVWDWVAETGRILIDSTSRLLRRLETPELKVEEPPDHELRLESDRDAGGGYDPYGRTPAKKGSGAGRAINPAGNSPQGSGGGYDPYSRDIVRKRK